MWQKFWSFIEKAFSDNGAPSSSRIISAWLSVSSMSLLWFVAHHMMSQPTDKLAVWLGNAPLVIGALATFAVSPYGVNKLTSMFQKGGEKIVEEEKKPL